MERQDRLVRRALKALLVRVSKASLARQGLMARMGSMASRGLPELAWPAQLAVAVRRARPDHLAWTVKMVTMESLVRPARQDETELREAAPG